MIAEAQPPNSAEPAGSPIVGLVPPEADGKVSARPAPAVEVLDAESAEERYYELRDRSQVLANQGRLDEALAALEESLQVAREIGDENLVATAICNVAGIAIWLGNTTDYVADLRSILMRNFDAETSYRAAYQLSHAFVLRKEFKKALFYGKIARDRALAAADDLYVGRSLNQIGLGLMGDSRFQKAVRHFQDSMFRLGSVPAVSIGPKVNCAYCLIVLGLVHEGMAQLFSSLRWMKRRNTQPVSQGFAHLFLCCGYLELGRVRRAWTHGMKARELSEETGDFELMKGSLFMLGDVERTAGDNAAAYEWFAEMQRRFYPNDPGMPELMSQVGMTKVVNLKA